MPDPKHDRSTYNHWDSTEADQWARLAALFRNVALDSTNSRGNLSTQIGDSANLDAFARLRVSEPVGLFDSQHQYDSNRILWENSITDNSGNAAVTHDADEACMNLYVEASDSIIRQTRQYFRYQPGKSELILITFVMSAQDPNLSQQIGYFDAGNGIFLSDNGADYYIVRRSSDSGSPVDNPVIRSSWNIDPFDGSGPSGITLDFAKSQILIIDLEWLGVGRVRVGFVIDGIPYYAHEFLNANNLSTVYMTTANLPIRYSIQAGAGLSSGKTLKAICVQVASEGGFEVARGLLFSATNANTLRTVTNAALLPLVSIRPKLTFNSITNRGWILPESTALYSSSVSAHWQLVWGATITGGAWGSLQADSICDRNITATSMSGGIIVESGYVSATVQSRGAIKNEVFARFPLFLDISGAHPTTPYTDTLTIAMISLGNDTDCGASLEVREIR